MGNTVMYLSFICQKVKNLGSLLSNINQKLHFERNENYVYRELPKGMFLFIIDFVYFPLLCLQFERIFL